MMTRRQTRAAAAGLADGFRAPVGAGQRRTVTTVTTRHRLDG